jgi:hypothetical protein
MIQTVVEYYCDTCGQKIEDGGMARLKPHYELCISWRDHEFFINTPNKEFCSITCLKSYLVNEIERIQQDFNEPYVGVM